MGAIYVNYYPNGKWFIYSTRTVNVSDFGRPDGKLIAKDFSRKKMDVFIVKRTLLWESDFVTKEELAAKTIKYIIDMGSNDPDQGYNKFPKMR